MFNSFVPPTIPTARPPDGMMDIPQKVVGLIIGKAGMCIIALQHKTGAEVNATHHFKSRVWCTTRVLLR